MISASKFGANMEDGNDDLELNDDEKSIVDKAKGIWQSILNVDIKDDTDFFACGAGSMDVVRYQICNSSLLHSMSWSCLLIART